MKALKNRIKRHEGLSLIPYRCPAGYWTVGYGHRLSTYSPDPISRNDAEVLLEQDIHHASEVLMGCGFVPFLNLTRRECLVELIFWVGPTGFFRFKRMIAAIWQQNFKLAALELYHSQLGDKYSSRAAELAELMWEGHDGSSA